MPASWAKRPLIPFTLSRSWVWWPRPRRLREPWMTSGTPFAGLGPPRLDDPSMNPRPLRYTQPQTEHVQPAITQTSNHIVVDLIVHPIRVILI